MSTNIGAAEAVNAGALNDAMATLTQVANQLEKDSDALSIDDLDRLIVQADSAYRLCKERLQRTQQLLDNMGKS